MRGVQFCAKSVHIFLLGATRGGCFRKLHLIDAVINNLSFAVAISVSLHKGKTALSYGRFFFATETASQNCFSNETVFASDKQSFE